MLVSWLAQGAGVIPQCARRRKRREREEGEKLAPLCRNHRAKNAINFVCKEIALAHSLITSARRGAALTHSSVLPPLRNHLLETSPKSGANFEVPLSAIL